MIRCSRYDEVPSMDVFFLRLCITAVTKLPHFAENILLPIQRMPMQNVNQVSPAKHWPRGIVISREILPVQQEIWFKFESINTINPY